MSRTELTINEVDIDGLNMTDAFETAASEMKILYRDGLIVELKNESGSSLTFTIKTPASVLLSGGVSVSDHTVTIANSKTYVISEIDRLFEQSDNYIYFDFSVATSVSIGCYTRKNL